jgi:hypothetical protein
LVIIDFFVSKIIQSFLRNSIIIKFSNGEEDVKDAYIKALGLKGYTKGLIDIQTEEIWFEAKDTGKHSSYAMFTQLLHYVQQSLNKGETVPPFLAVIDTEKAAIMKSSDVIPFLEKKTVKWGKSASQYTQEALEAISAYIGTYFVSFKLATHEEEFISTVKAAIKSGDIIRTQITPDNLKQVFDKWVEMIGKELLGVTNEDYALLFFANIMNDLGEYSKEHGSYDQQNNILRFMAYAYARRTAAAGLFLQGYWSREYYDHASNFFKSAQLSTGQSVEFQENAAKQSMEFLLSYDQRLNKNLVGPITAAVELNQVVSIFETGKRFSDEQIFEIFSREAE